MTLSKMLPNLTLLDSFIHITTTRGIYMHNMLFYIDV